MIILNSVPIYKHSYIFIIYGKFALIVRSVILQITTKISCTIVFVRIPLPLFSFMYTKITVF